LSSTDFCGAVGLWLDHCDEVRVKATESSTGRNNLSSDPQAFISFPRLVPAIQASLDKHVRFDRIETEVAAEEHPSSQSRSSPKNDTLCKFLWLRCCREDFNSVSI